MSDIQDNPHSRHVMHAQEQAKSRGEALGVVLYLLTLGQLALNPDMSAGNGQYGQAVDAIHQNVDKGEHVYLYYLERTVTLGGDETPLPFLPIKEAGTFWAQNTQDPPPLVASPGALRCEVVYGERDPTVQPDPNADKQVLDIVQGVMDGNLQLSETHQTFMRALPPPTIGPATPSDDDMKKLNDQLQEIQHSHDTPEQHSTAGEMASSDDAGDDVAALPPAVSEPVLIDTPAVPADAPDDGGGGAVAVAAAPVAAMRAAAAAPNGGARDIVQLSPMISELIQRIGPRRPPIPSHPEWGLPSVAMAWEDKAAQLRKLDGHAVDDGFSLKALVKALLGVSSDVVPFVPRPADGDVDDTVYARLLTAGHWRPAVESIQPGDVVWYADGADTDGANIGIALSEGAGEMLTVPTMSNSYAVRQWPQTAARTQVWQPLPRWTFNPAGAIGAFWGPDLAGMRKLVADLYANSAAEIGELCAHLAGVGRWSGVTDAPSLVRALLPAMHLVTDKTPLWPGAIVLGRGDGDVGVLLPDGWVLGSCSLAEYPGSVASYSPLRFRPTFIWYPPPAKA
jgi:hypothetical protein